MVVRGRATFEWLEGRRFVMWRSHYDRPEIPDATAVIGVTGGRLLMRRFDARGAYEVFEVGLDADQWRFWGEADGVRQRFTGSLSDDGDVIVGLGQRSGDGARWDDDLAITYRRSPAGRAPLTGGHPDLAEMARRVIDTNHYMTLATVDPDGRPRLSPVYYTSARYSDFYWVSSPEAQHSHNVAERPEAEIVIFDSSVPVSEAEAVYLSATVRAVGEDELEAVCSEAFRTTAGARRFAPDDLRGDDLRLYVAHARSCEVLVRGGHPTHGRGTDTRQYADPTAVG